MAAAECSTSLQASTKSLRRPKTADTRSLSPSIVFQSARAGVGDRPGRTPAQSHQMFVERADCGGGPVRGVANQEPAAQATLRCQYWIIKVHSHVISGIVRWNVPEGSTHSVALAPGALVAESSGLDSATSLEHRRPHA